MYIASEVTILETLFTPEEVAANLRVNIRTVYKWLREERLNARMAGGRWRITEQNVADFLAAPRRKPRAVAGSGGVEAGPSSASSSTPASVSGPVAGGLATPSTDAFLEGRSAASALAGMKRNQKRKK